MQEQSSNSLQANKNYLSATQSQDSPTPFKRLHLHNKHMVLDESHFPRSLITHPKTSKSASYNTNKYSSTHEHSKKCQKALKSQDKLSSLLLTLETKKTIENKLLLPILRNFPSLSSLTIFFSGNFEKDIGLQELLLKTLASLKHLNRLDLIFFFLLLDKPQTLKKLMKTIEKVRRISSLSLTFYTDYGSISPHYNIVLSKLTRIPHLRRLKLYFYLSEDLLNTDVEFLASVLPKLSLLTELDLTFQGNRTLSESTLLRLFKAFQNMKNLSNLALDLEGCTLASESILESLKCLVGTSVRKFSLGAFRNFDDQSLQQLSQALKELILLKGFSLRLRYDPDLSNESISDFGSALACLTSITSLDLRFSFEIEGKNIVQAIASALKSLHNLAFLRLEFPFMNGTDDQQWQALFASLKPLKSLRDLEILIEQDIVTDASLETLGESLKELNLLETLSLYFLSSLITNSGVEALCSGLQKGPSNLSSLTLTFEDNKNINEKALGHLGEALKALVSLGLVDLSFTECFDGADFKGLFSVLREMKNLEQIILWLPESEENRREVHCLKKIKDIVSANFFEVES